MQNITYTYSDYISTVQAIRNECYDRSAVAEYINDCVNKNYHAACYAVDCVEDDFEDELNDLAMLEANIEANLGFLAEDGAEFDMRQTVKIAMQILKDYAENHQD